MITHRFALDDIGEAFRSAARPGECLKVLIEPDDGIMTIADGLGEQVREYRKGSDRYETW